MGGGEMNSIEIVTLVTAIVGAVCGICGAVLGIINTWSQVSRNRVRLKVIPKLAYMTGANNVIKGDRRNEEFQRHLANQGATSRWCIEVINLSAPSPLLFLTLGSEEPTGCGNGFFAPRHPSARVGPPVLSRERR